MDQNIIPPHSVIGILGGGQLGRMMAIAGAQMGYRFISYDQGQDCPAAQVCQQHIAGAWDDFDALARFAEAVDIVTYEFENIPLATVEFIAARRPLRPGLLALQTMQDRRREKLLFNDLNIPTTNWAEIDSLEALESLWASWGQPAAILKTARLGYDGHGQFVFADEAGLKAGYEALAKQKAGLILEQKQTLIGECSVVIARQFSNKGKAAYQIYDVGLNHHEDQILRTTTVPVTDVMAMAPAKLQQMADAAVMLAEKLDYCGVMAVEFFINDKGDVLANEMAPRPHNSGHWTIEGARTSQFAQHIRAICGLPLGDVTRTAPRVEMDNLLGDDVDDWLSHVSTKNSFLHLYGKGEARPKRKMGHVTRLIFS